MDYFGSHNNVVNSNDNPRHHWLNIYDSEEQAKYAVCIPIANKLIEKHCGLWWKNHPTSPEFNSCQHSVCRVIEAAHLYQEYIYLILSASLKCNHIALANDPEFKYLSQA